MLIKLDLSYNNNLQGEIPPSLGKCEELNLFALSNNNLSGSIPPQIVGLSSLSILVFLSSNHLTGILVVEVGKLINLGMLDVSQNMLFDVIPNDLGNCIRLEVLKLLSHGASGSFLAECEASRNVRHRNLIKRCSLCVGSSCIKSLEDWLHPPVGINIGGEEAKKSLNLFQRLNVAVDAGCTLEYVHHHYGTPIVHYDLKPTNILLDEEMVGHVGDFGLAKFVTSNLQNRTSSQSSSLGFKGTIGYASPEYGLGSSVKTYSDVLEMFTGRRPTDEMFKENLNLHSFFKTALPNHVVEITDPILLQESFRGETGIHNTLNERSQKGNKLLWGLTSIFEIGVAFSSELPTERMKMVNVVA
ncbi:hypothetical protein PTKIN_Ptkin16aG0532900 [Pterospermum kingtungense]